MAIVKRAFTVRQSDLLILWQDEGPGTWGLTDTGVGETTVTFPEVFTQPPVVLAGAFSAVSTAPVNSSLSGNVDISGVTTTSCVVVMYGQFTSRQNGSFTLEVVGEVA